ncbi:hypothetical protein K457DRAFT_21172 [Linnemannia elongata AG-77]|uniref:WD40 repeat-like protein n=1 Tax=Linnemannia elongata AG-77 TaxID=1314771 RepID=A0A197JQ28_9FUNG|nr:hypothetical protein K457DRAFT_21172 [Linnemannia elongata AG-77]
MAVGLVHSIWLWNLVAGKKAEGGEGRGEWKCVVRIQDIFGHVGSIAWKPNTLEFSVGCANGTFQVWRLVETLTSSSDEWSAQLIWSTGNPVLAASDALFADAVGLSSASQKLLTQRCKGAAA